MSAGQITQFAVAFFLTALGLFVLRARPHSPVNQAFAAQTMLFAGWVLGIAGLQSSHYLGLWSRLPFPCASLIPAAFVLFSHRYPVPTSWPSPLLRRSLYGLGALFMILSLASDLVAYDIVGGPSGMSRRAGPLYPLFALYFLGTCCVGFWTFICKWRSSRGLERGQLQYLGVGIVTGFAGGISTNLLIPLVTGQSTYSWMGPYFCLPYVGLVAHAIIRHRLMDLRFFIHRGLTIANGGHSVSDAGRLLLIVVLAASTHASSMRRSSRCS